MDQIRTKAIVNVSREGSSSFESCSTWEGANDLPWERKGLPGGPKGEIIRLTINFIMFLRMLLFHKYFSAVF